MTIKKEKENDYIASNIEVLEGLEPVRRRPGMYIGGTDSKAMHHLFAEVIDNSMDEAIAGYASWIQVDLEVDGYLTVSDNGRGIPVDIHPKFKNKSALEVIMTTLHAGGKFDRKAYETSGGLHGVGISVVNALSSSLIVEVARDRKLYRQTFSRGLATSSVETIGEIKNRRGTRIRFLPDTDIFGASAKFEPLLLYEMARSKAYLFGGVEVRWSCDSQLLTSKNRILEKDLFHFPAGLKDYLIARIGKCNQIIGEPFSGSTKKKRGHGYVEWAITWFDDDGFVKSYCNTVPTRHGGTHESGLRSTLTRCLKNYSEIIGNKKGSLITTDDVMISAAAMLSVFISEPEFTGQTKDKLATVEAQRIVDTAIRNAFDHWLAASPNQASKLLEWIISHAKDRLRRRQDKENSRKKALRKVRLPGKLADCAKSAKGGTEIFIVEGDSAGGSAKQARDRKNQAILPLRGKILNVASASHEKLRKNEQISELIQALGCGTRTQFSIHDLRYDRVIIMTDADVDGAHIASLLITFFYQEMPEIITSGRLYLAVPPLYKLTQLGKTLYARDDSHKEELLVNEFNRNKRIEIRRFKGLGEMMPYQLKETTMDPLKRKILRVSINHQELTKQSIDQLMGNKPGLRFRFIQKNAEFANDALLDV